MHRTQMQVPGIVAAYNRFMNGVDRMDQLRASSSAKRREKRVYMSLLSWILDLSVNSGLAIYKEMRCENQLLTNLTVAEFKRLIMQGLVAAHIAQFSIAPEPSCTVRPHGKSSHLLLKSKGTRLRCFVCSALGFDAKVTQFCLACNRGFHINCFSIYHNREFFRQNASIEAKMQLVDRYECVRARDRPSTKLPNINSIDVGE